MKNILETLQESSKEDVRGLGLKRNYIAHIHINNITRRKNMTRLVTCIAFLAMVLLPVPAQSHSGGLDANGCHAGSLITVIEARATW